jgi:pyridoxal kinase
MREILNALLDFGAMYIYSVVLIGYVGSEDVLREILNFVEKIKNRVSVYCDPVCGDGGRLYVPNGVPEVYRNLALPLSDIIFPNFYELSLLIPTNNSLNEKVNFEKAIESLHHLGPSTIIVTSLDCVLASRLSGNMAFNEMSMYVYVSVLCDCLHCKQEAKKFVVVGPRLLFNNQSDYFTGTGDALASLVAGFNQLEKSKAHKKNQSFCGTVSVIRSVKNAVLCVVHILKVTCERGVQKFAHLPPELIIGDSLSYVAEASRGMNDVENDDVVQIVTL